MDTVETQLPSTVSSPQLARAFLRAALGTWKLDGFGDVTELLASELVANVVTHVGAPMTLRVQRTPSTMRVEIDDPSTEVPVVRHPDEADEHGRGVLLVDQLANAWGVDTRADGKTVWFELDVSTATDEVHHHPAAALTRQSSIQSCNPTVSSARRGMACGLRSRSAPPSPERRLCTPTNTPMVLESTKVTSVRSTVTTPVRGESTSRRSSFTARSSCPVTVTTGAGPSSTENCASVTPPFYRAGCGSGRDVAMWAHADGRARLGPVTPDPPRLDGFHLRS